jgi:hypothetical protein
VVEICVMHRRMNMKKYEVTIIRVNHRMEKREKYEKGMLGTMERENDEKLDKMQDEGWEIAGSILVESISGPHYDARTIIPMKRLKDK